MEKEKREKRSYDPEFRIQAVKYLKSCGKSVKKAAEELGVNPRTLTNWCEVIRKKGERGLMGEEGLTEMEVKTTFVKNIADTEVPGF
ncbi:MAG: transposase [Candidatus Wallbacteria bacterium]|nr:transposase [Candidatus Wallbacteria bacterium]